MDNYEYVMKKARKLEWIDFLKIYSNIEKKKTEEPGIVLQWEINIIQCLDRTFLANKQQKSVKCEN